MKKETLNKLEELLKNEDFRIIVESYDTLKAEYETAREEQNKSLLEAFVSGGGEAKDFSPAADDDDRKFKELINLFNDKKKRYLKQKAEQEQKNFEAKSALIDELKALVEKEENIKSSFEKFNEIREKWMNTGFVNKAKAQALNEEYNHIVEKFYYNISIYKELKVNDLKKNLKLRKDIIAKIVLLAKEENMKTAEYFLNAAIKEWEDVGPVNKENWEKLKEEYFTALNAVRTKIRAFYESQKGEQQQNLAKKLLLCEEAEKIDTSTLTSAKHWEEKTDFVLGLQEVWRSIGYAQANKNKIIWKRFRAACDAFFESKKTFFAGMKDMLSKNKSLKESLIEKAHLLKSSTDWENTTKKLIALQRDWKTVGNAGQRDEHKLWASFREACDHFFQAKQAQLEKENKKEEEQLNLKKALIEKVKAYTPNADKQQNIQFYKEATEQWNKIGYVPEKAEKAINELWQTTIKELATKIQVPVDELHQARFEAKLVGLQQAENPVPELRKEKSNIEKEIVRITGEVMQLENNMGFFRNSKNASGLIAEISEKVSKGKAEVEKLKLKIKQIDLTIRKFNPAPKPADTVSNPS